MRTSFSLKKGIFEPIKSLKKRVSSKFFPRSADHPRLWGLRYEDAPISSIPPEILCKIFDIGYFSLEIEERVLFALLLSQVTYHWRDVAVDRSILWTSFALRSLPIPKLWLKRSKGRLLDLYLKVDSFFKPDQLPQFGLDTLITQCRSLSLFFGNIPSGLQVIEFLQPLGAPRLEQLTLSVTQSGALLPMRRMFTAGAPLLSDLRLRNIVLGNYSFYPLQSFYFDYDFTTSGIYNYPRFRALFSSLSSLTRLVLKGPSIDCRPEDAVQAIPFPKLISLGFSCSKGSEKYIAFVIKALDAPSLECLAISCKGEFMLSAVFNQLGFDSELACVSKFPSLRAVYLKANGNMDFTPLLFKIPTITTVFFDVRNLRDTLEQLVELDETSCPWPLLTTLYLGSSCIDSHWFASIYVDLLADLAQTRTALGYPLSTIYLEDGDVFASSRMSVSLLNDLVQVVKLSVPNCTECEALTEWY